MLKISKQQTIYAVAVSFISGSFQIGKASKQLHTHVEYPFETITTAARATTKVKRLRKRNS